uniref:C39 family peptidase n=1 Tax=Eubacterium cellulosolvens TaxID=29322 RepID=UPI0006844C2B|nr:C39 family peptidase [[Eubacterium] cellulosolvens]
MNDRLIQDRVSQNDITTKNGRFIRDRHSRLVEQNRRMERERQRSRLATVLVFGLAAILSITPVSNAVKSFLNGRNNRTAEAVASTSSSSAQVAYEVLKANPVKADKNTVTSTEGSTLKATSANGKEATVSSSVADSMGPNDKKDEPSTGSSGTENTAPSVPPSADTSPAATTESAVPSEESPKPSADDAARTAENYLMLHTSMGPMLYYNQDDPLWRDYLWGGTDPFHEYGCGPTACAMIANSFGNSPEQITPIAMAEWAVQDHDFARGSGSYNTLIQNSLTAYGLKVVSRQNVISENMIRDELHAGHILVCLMGPGEFTDSGHFIILTALNEDGTISVADPVSLKRTKTHYDPALIVSQLDAGRANGGPIWTVYR